MALVFPYIWIPSGGVGPVEIVLWKRGTDEQIKAMIDAADAGEINLSDYWSVGDTRTVHLSAMTAGNGLVNAQPEQDVVLALMNEGYPGEGNEGVHFVWGQVNGLSKSGRMDPSSATWYNCAMRADLNDKYYNAFSTTFRNCLKQFNVIAAETRGGSTNQISRDYISLFAEKEIFGYQTKSNSTEANALSQIEYYKTASNRIKLLNGSLDVWWGRSISDFGSNWFCYVDKQGQPRDNPGNNSFIIAPFGCI